MHFPPLSVPLPFRPAAPYRWALVALLSLILCPAAAAPAAAQAAPATPVPTDTLVEVRLVDGSVLTGTVVSVDESRLTLRTTSGGSITIDRDQILSVRVARGEVRGEGEFWPEDPSATRLFFTATGRSLRRGQGYVGSYLIVLPFVGYGLTDRFTVAGGAPLLLGEIEPLYLAPKLQVLAREDVAVSIGTIAVFLREEDPVGIVYGVGTFGNPDRALTAGVGFGFAGEDFASRPVAMVGGESRLGRSVKVMTENYFLPGESGFVFSGGVRFLGERFTGDLGVGGLAGDDGVECCLPLVNVSWSFGGR